MPTDAELIQLLREQLHKQDEAIHNFLDVLERTGNERHATYEAFKNTVSYGLTMANPTYLQGFIAAYERTMPERLAASKALHEALTMDFRTAMLVAHDATDEMRAEWLAEPAA